MDDFLDSKFVILLFKLFEDIIVDDGVILRELYKFFAEEKLFIFGAGKFSGRLYKLLSSADYFEIGN